MVDLLFHWQDLIGSIIGASIPLFFWFISRWIQKYSKHREDLKFLEGVAVLAINNLLDCKKTLKNFVDIKISTVLQNIETDTKNNRYSISKAYLPMFYVHSFSEVVLSLDVRSGYLKNVVLKAYSLSKDSEIGIANLHEQYKDTLDIQKEISVLKLNSAVSQNRMYEENLIQFTDTVNKQVLENNFSVYLKILVQLQQATLYILKIGILNWKFKFEPHFKFFKSKHELEEYRRNTHTRISDFLQPLVEKQIEDIKISNF